MRAVKGALKNANCIYGNVYSPLYQDKQPAVLQSWKTKN